jgi:hypothetical protein
MMNRQLLRGRIIYSPLLLVLMALVCACSPKAKAPTAVDAEVPTSSTSELPAVSTSQVLVAANTPQAPAPAQSSVISSSPAPSSADQASAAVPATRNLAGTVAVSDGSALLYGPDRVGHKLSVGDKVYEGDALVTLGDAELHLNMADGGYIAIRPNTTLRITLYQANGDSTDKSVVGLLKGSFRSITGWIGKSYPANYAVNTPTATIGVRGTDHEPAYVPEGVAGQDAGTYDNVYAGGTTISNSAGHVDVSPDHVGFVDPKRNVAPRVLEHVPNFYKAPHRNDQLLVGKHAQVVANLEHLRTARATQHAEEVKNGTAVRSGPTSLRDRMIQNHAEATLAARKAELTGARGAAGTTAAEEARRNSETALANRRTPLERRSQGSPPEHPNEPAPKGSIGNGAGAARMEEARRATSEAVAKAVADARAKAAAARTEPAKKRDDNKTHN